MYAFIYHWYLNDEINKEGEKVMVIRAYGLLPNGDTVILHIQSFQPWMYIEVKKNGHTLVDWTKIRSIIKNKLMDRCKHLKNNTFYVMNKKKLYFYHNDKEYPYFKLRFANQQTRKNVYYSINKYETFIMGKRLEFRCHEVDATPLLQLIVSRNLPTAGWISFEGFRVHTEDKISTLDNEFNVHYEKLYSVSSAREVELGVPVPTLCSFDIEVYSSNSQRMPLSDNPLDCIFQISCVVKKNNALRKYLLTLGNILSYCLEKHTIVRSFENEKKLLLGFTAFVREINPHVIIGYNIFGFDLPYMIARAKYHDILFEFDVMGIPLYKHAPEKEIKWSSTAYSYQEFHYLDAEGRIFVDLLPVVRRDYKFSNYKLKTVSTFFLGETKDPLTAQDIFKAYEEGMKNTEEGNRLLSLCGKYCVQDSALVLKLFEILQLWIGLSEMAKICHVPIMYLFTKGQQIKVYSQIYKKCYYENRLVESVTDHPILENCQGYSGAFVFPPTPGIYQWVIPFDFSSLYPTTIIAYNIDYSTLVLDESTVDLNDCHIIEWEDHIQCEHDKNPSKSQVKKLCGKNRFVFRKSPPGVLPSLLKDLLDKRSETKKKMKSISKEISDPTILETQMVVLDKRQLAYKLSANSGYGAMGVKKGYLPFMPGAMSTTAMGRMSIQKAAEFVQSTYKGNLIYGDSVEKSTPIAIKIGSKIKILSIEQFFELYQDKKSPYSEFKSEDQRLYSKEKIDIESHDNQVMTFHGWKPVRKIIRHKTYKRLYRVFTNSGIVDVTEDHSLILANGLPIKPDQIKKEDRCAIIDHQAFWQNATTDISTDLLNNIQILSNGTLIFMKNYNEHKNDVLTLYLYLLHRFPSVHLQCFEKYIIFDPSMESREDGVFLSYEDLGFVNDYVYDLETTDGTFHAGVGNLVLKNTDSIYCHFPSSNNAKNSWLQAKTVEQQLLQLFPSPMKLVFEEKIYQTFLILTKKRYMAYTCDESGKTDEKLTIRGVLLARRDNCRWIRNLYETIVRIMMDRAKCTEVYEKINSYILDFMYWNQSKYPLSHFIITKQVNKDYKIKPLPVDIKKCKKRLQDLGINFYPEEIDIESINRRLQDTWTESWINEYILKTKPAHVQLAHRMTNRGKPVEPGSRIEFIIIQHPDDPKSKLNDKLEDPVYFKQHRDLLRMDRLYYLKSLAEPMDQLIQVVFRKKDFVTKIYEHHIAFLKVMNELKNRESPIVLFDDEVYKKPRKAICKKKKETPKKTLYDYL